MSLHRIAAAQRLCAAARGISSKGFLLARPIRLSRCQSTGARPRRRGVARTLLYGATATGLAFGGSLIYANYDPAFKDGVNLYVPGYAAVVDYAADRWVDLVDYVRPKQSPHMDKKMKVEVIVEPPKEDPFKRAARKKRETARDSGATPPTAGDESLSSAESTDVSGKERGGHPLSQSVIPVEDIVVVPASSQEGPPKPRTQEPIPDNLPTEEEAPPPPPPPPPPSSSVESTVAHVKEETARAAQELMTEQLREHQETQASEEHLQWLKDSAEVDARLQELYNVFVGLSDKVLAAQKTLTEAIQNYHHHISEATTKSVEDESTETMAELIVKAEETVKSSQSDLKEATMEHRAAAEELKTLLDRAMGLGLRSKVEQMASKLTECATELLLGAAAIAEAEADSKVLEEYQREVESGKQQLQSELGTELPQADSQQEALRLLLQRRVEVLKKRLEETEEQHTKKLAEALEKQKANFERLSEEKMKWKLKKQAHDFEEELKQKLEELDEDYAMQLRDQLRQQTEKHTRHLTEALQVQADQLSSKWSSELEQKLLEQQSYYQLEMAKALSRLRGIESMVNTVVAAGEVTRQQQSLRAACDAFRASLEQANSERNPREYYSFSSEISSLREACGGDHFILSMLDALPRAAVTKEIGIQSEMGLRERFKKVKRVCRRVALVPETGGGLGTYVLSYLQSLLMINAWRSKSIWPDSDPRDMDTFEILQQADAYLRHGDLERAIRSMNCLQGESRRLAEDWLTEARLCLETHRIVCLIQQYIMATSISMTTQ